MRKIGLLLSLVLLISSCIRTENLSYDGIESVEMRSLGTAQSAVDVTINASNASGTAVKVVRAELTLGKDGQRLLEAYVDGKVKLPRRFEGSVVIPVRVRFDGGALGALRTVGLLSKGGRGTTVSGTVVLKAGLARKKIEIKDMETGRFLRLMGIDLSDMMKEYGL